MNDQRGVAYAILTIFLFVLVTVVVLGASLSQVSQNATEVQTIAEAAATAGASAMLRSLRKGDGHAAAARNATSEGKAVALQNKLAASAAVDLDIKIGRWIPAKKKFIPLADGGLPPDAVRAQAAVDVPLIFSRFWRGSERSRLKKTAVAGRRPYTPVPFFPWMIGDRHFAVHDCATPLRVERHIDSVGEPRNTAWTNFATAAGGGATEDLTAFMPSTCCDQSSRSCGGGWDIPPLNIGQSVRLLPGPNHEVDALLLGCIEQGYDTWRIGVFECKQDQQPPPYDAVITGFATMRVVSDEQAETIAMDISCPSKDLMPADASGDFVVLLD